MIEFTVDIKPVSVNHAYIRVGNRVITTKKYKEYKEALGWAATSANEAHILFKKPIVTITFIFGDKRRRDIDNCVKPTLDAINGILWEDDSQINELHLYKKYEKGRNAVTIRVE